MQSLFWWSIFFYQRCACHILNLCVQNGLTLLQDYITPIRKAFHYLWKYPQVMKKWVKFWESRNMRPVRFSCDVPTRWNSTYKLLCQSD